jgi:hypothetical protein
MKSKPFEEFFFKIRTTSRAVTSKKFIHYKILKLKKNIKSVFVIDLIYNLLSAIYKIIKRS